MMLNYNKRSIKIHLLIYSFILLSIPHAYPEYVGIAFDADEAPALREAIFNPFIINGLTPISENNLNYYETSLPNPIPDFWQVISINRDTLEKYCQLGTLINLNWENFPHKELLNPTAMTSCGIGHSISATVMAYSIIHKYGLPPNRWSDFFNLDRYPGKRALPSHPRGVLEIALLADGIPAHDLYPLLMTDAGIERAFKKLDTIKDEILWWDDINELRQWLINGDVALAIAQDGPLLYADGRDNIGIVRDQVIYRLRYYAIPRNAKNHHLAYSFISYATHPNRQKKLYSLLPYGPSINQGWALFNDYERRYLTNYPQNLKKGVAEDYHFYMERGDQITQQYRKWHTGFDLPIKPIEVSYIQSQSTLIDIDDANKQHQKDPNFMGPPIPEQFKKSKTKESIEIIGPPMPTPVSKESHENKDSL